MKLMRCGIAGAVALIAGSASASVTYTFENITGNSATSAAQGEAQLKVEVYPVAPSTVGFRFTAAGPAAMSIAQIYFDDSSLLGSATIINGTGVVFASGGSPGNLPGGNSISPAFQATSSLVFSANSPRPQRGVNPGEQLAIVFNLLGGKTYADVIGALNGGSDLRIGLHVQSFANGESESFVNNVPTPGALALAGVGLLAAGRRRRPR